MKQLDSLNQVAEFHHTYRHPTEEKPLIPSPLRCKLRVELIEEELRELEEAIAENDLVAVADALCDIQYVLSGAVLEFGMGEKFRDLFDEVHRSNMSKACDNEEDAIATVQYYRDRKSTESYYKEVDGKYMIYRKEDNKTLKSIKYSPADLKSILEK